MRKTFFRLTCIISIMIFVTGCNSKKSTREISNTLGVDLSSGIISQNIDSHGGFHSDGTTYFEMTFSDTEGEPITETIKMNEDWNTLPLTENLNIALYGKETPTESYGPYVTSEDGKPIFPIVENGYYFFLDRHSKIVDMKNDTELHNRHSYNFTITIYDTDKKILHYCEFDT